MGEKELGRLWQEVQLLYRLLKRGREGERQEQLEEVGHARSGYQFELLLMKLQKNLSYDQFCRVVVEVVPNLRDH